MRKVLSRGLGGLSGAKGIRRMGAALGVGSMRERKDGQEEPKL